MFVFKWMHGTQKQQYLITFELLTQEQRILKKKSIAMKEYNQDQECSDVVLIDNPENSYQVEERIRMFVDQEEINIQEIWDKAQQLAINKAKKIINRIKTYQLFINDQIMKKQMQYELSLNENLVVECVFTLKTYLEVFFEAILSNCKWFIKQFWCWMKGYILIWGFQQAQQYVLKEFLSINTIKRILKMYFPYLVWMI